MEYIKLFLIGFVVGYILTALFIISQYQKEKSIVQRITKEDYEKSL